MRLPVVRGLIERRILINFRADPDVLARLLTPPFRPKLVWGFGVAGICLIRLADLRPRALPAVVGRASENAAHRIAVEWEEGGVRREGVYIPRRDTSSRFNTFSGGRLFPGLHHHARFDVTEEGDTYRVRMESDDGAARVAVEARIRERLPATSVFASLGEASAFFQRGALGYSPSARPGELDALELHTLAWSMEPLELLCVESSFFGDSRLFPEGAVELDSGFLMRRIAHEWYARPRLRTAS